MRSNGQVGLRRGRRTLAALLATTLSVAAGMAGSGSVAAEAAARGAQAVRESARAMPSVRFEPNRGQTGSAARFIVRGGGPPAFLTASDAVFVLPKAEAALDPAPGRGHDGAPAPSPSPTDVAGTVVRLHLRNGNPNPVITAEDQLTGTTNYLLGKDRNTWVTGVPSYAAVRYHGVYPGVDMVYHSGKDGQLEYDFVVAPGANPAAIELEFQGADTVSASAGDGLSVSTPAGVLQQRSPAIYQDLDGSRRVVSGGYALRPEHRVGFSIGAHDPTRQLVIDPLLSYSTYLGGTLGNGNEGTGIVADSGGSGYLTGESLSVVDFPTTPGAYQYTYPGTNVNPAFTAFVTKMSPDGSSLVYSTFLGGNGGSCYFCGDKGLGIAIDSAGDAYVTGETSSANFPVTSGAYQSSLRGPGGSGFPNAFLSKLNPQGSALLYSTYLGGTGGDHGQGVAVDGAGDALVTGTTSSPDFPVTSNAFQTGCRSNCPTNSDGVSTSGSTTYTSASANFDTFDIGRAITGTNLATGTTIAGVESPTSLTLSTAATGSGSGLTFTIPGGSRQHSAAFLAKLDPTQSGAASLPYATLLGGGLGESSAAISLDSQGVALVTGSTASADFPTTPGVYQPTCQSCPAYTDGLIDANLTTLHSASANFTQADVFPLTLPDLFGTRIGSNTHVASVVNATTITLDTPALSAGATNFTIPYRPNRGESYVARLDPGRGSAALLYSTFLGRHGADQTAGIAVDSVGNAYVTGRTSSADFPTTAGAFDRTCHQTTNSPCGVTPTFTDGAGTSGSRTFTSASASFDAETDGGQAISAPNLPTGTTVAGVVNPTTITLSQPATASASGLTFSLVRNKGSEGFVTKLNRDATALVYSTYLGGTSRGTDNAISVDGSGRAVVVGTSASGTTYPLRDQVADFGGATDAAVTQLTADGSGLVFSTFLGGAGDDDAFAVFVDSGDVVYVTGNTTSSNFPTTSGAFQPARGGSGSPALGNAFIAKLAPVSSSLPYVSRLSVQHGPLAGGELEVLTGHGFTGATSVSFGSVPATGLTVSSDAQITATIPPQAAPAAGTTLAVGVTVTTGAGSSPVNQVNRYTYGEGQWTGTGPLSTPRSAATSTLLSNGKVLVTGGAITALDSAPYAGSELYDPASGTWTATGALNVARRSHSATLLNNGKVLVVGGWTGSAAVAYTEIYDPAGSGCGAGITGCWTPVAPLPGGGRFMHTATLLPSGKVLVAGGQPDGSNTQLATALVYDPAANTWTSVGSMSIGRSTATATLLLNGKVLVAGGCCLASNVVSPTAELFDPAGIACGTAGCWTPTGSLGQARLGHTATLLPSGQVLVTGGSTYTGAAFTSMEVYDPLSGSWSLVGSLQHPRVGHTATLLPNGVVLLAGGLGAVFSSPGGLQTAELFDPASPSNTAAADLMLVGRGQDMANNAGIGGPSFTATLLPGGKVLTSGGSSDATAELFTFSVSMLAVLPAMANGAYGGYVTAATIENTGPVPASIRISYFDQTGTPVGADDTVAALPANGSWTVRQDNGHSFAAGAAGSAIVYSDRPVAAFVNEFAPGAAGDGSSYTGVPVPSGVGTSLFAPTIVNNAYGGYTTGIGLLNQGGAATDVTISYRDGTGGLVQTQTVSGLEAHGYRGLGSGNASLPSGFAGTATITNSTGQLLGAVVNETGPGGQFSSYDAVPSGSTLLNAPAALNSAYGGYYTGMGIQNATGSSGTVTVTYYDSAGAPTPRTFNLPGHGYLGVYQGSSADGPAPGAYTATIQSTVPVAAIVNEVAPAGPGSARQSTSYNMFGGGAGTVNLPLVENGGSDPWNTGEGIMNTGSSPTTVTVTYHDAAGGAAVGGAVSRTLAAHAFWGLYQPADGSGLPANSRATAVITTASGGQVAVICNESSPATLMSYDGQ